MSRLSIRRTVARCRRSSPKSTCLPSIGRIRSCVMRTYAARGRRVAVRTHAEEIDRQRQVPARTRSGREQSCASSTATTRDSFRHSRARSSPRARAPRAWITSVVSTAQVGGSFVESSRFSSGVSVPGQQRTGLVQNTCNAGAAPQDTRNRQACTESPTQGRAARTARRPRARSSEMRLPTSASPNRAPRAARAQRTGPTGQRGAITVRDRNTNCAPATRAHPCRAAATRGSRSAR